MVVKTELANGNFEVFETSNYVISKTKDFHPLLCKVSIYDNGKKIKSVSRPFKFFYKHFTFKSDILSPCTKTINFFIEISKSIVLPEM